MDETAHNSYLIDPVAKTVEPFTIDLKDYKAITPQSAPTASTRSASS